MSVQMVLKVCFSFFACAAVCVCEPCAAVCVCEPCAAVCVCEPCAAVCVCEPCAAVCVCEPCAAVGTEVAAMERSTMENGSASNR